MFDCQKWSKYTFIPGFTITSHAFSQINRTRSVLEEMKTWPSIFFFLPAIFTPQFPLSALPAAKASLIPALAYWGLPWRLPIYPIMLFPTCWWGDYFVTVKWMACMALLLVECLLLTQSDWANGLGVIFWAVLLVARFVCYNNTFFVL